MSPRAELLAGRRLGSLRVAASARRGAVQVSELQRSRMLSSAVAVVSEYGYGRMSVARVTDGAGVSRRTFYDLFEDREDCFLAAFDQVVARLVALLSAAYESEQGWREQVRAALTALLEFLDEEPGARALLILDALKAGPAVLKRRAQVLEQLSDRLHQGGLKAGAGRAVPPLTGEGVVGAVVGVLHTRLLAEQPGSMSELLGPLMGMIVLPYQGPTAAQKELARPTARIARAPRAREHTSSSSSNPLAELPMRITRRTLLVLTAIGQHPGASNRRVADLAGVSDQGQISKLLTRLQSLGLIENSSPGQPSGEPNKWQLTSLGEEVQQAINAQFSHTTLQLNQTRELH